MPSPDQPNHAIRDGMVRLIYVAGERGGFYKMFPDIPGKILMFKPAEVGEAGKMVGYAGFNEPKVDVQLIFTTGTLLGPVECGVWHLNNGVWTLKKGIPTDVAWGQAVASPKNPKHWACCMLSWSCGDGPTDLVDAASGHPVVWRTDDAGATWQGCHVELPPSTGAVDASQFYFDFLSDGQLCVVLHTQTGGIGAIAVYKGDTAALETAYVYDLLAGNTRTALGGFATGQDGDIFIQLQYDRVISTPYIYGGYLDKDNAFTWVTEPPPDNTDGAPMYYGFFVRLADTIAFGDTHSRALASVQSGNYVATGDYRLGPFAVFLKSDTNPLAWNSTGWITGVRDATWATKGQGTSGAEGVFRIDNPLTDGAVSATRVPTPNDPDATSLERYGPVRADRQTRTIAAIKASAGILVWHESTWKLIDGPLPPGDPSGPLSVWVEPIGALVRS